MTIVGYVLEEHLPAPMSRWIAELDLKEKQLWPPLLSVDVDISDIDAIMRVEIARSAALRSKNPAAADEDEIKASVEPFVFPLGPDEGVPLKEEGDDEEEPAEEEAAAGSDRAEDSAPEEAEPVAEVELDAAAEALSALRSRLPSRAQQDDLLTRAQFQNQLSNYEKLYVGIQSVLKSFPYAQTARQLIHLSGLDSADDLCEAILHALGQQKHQPRPFPTNLPKSVRAEAQPVAAAEEEEPSEPPQLRENIASVRKISSKLADIKEKVGLWQQFCPVTLAESDKLEYGSFEHAVSFNGNVYCPKDKLAKEKFLANPLDYISISPDIPSKFTVAIVGGPSIGKKTLASALASTYGFEVLLSSQLPSLPKPDSDVPPELNRMASRSSSRLGMEPAAASSSLLRAKSSGSSSALVAPLEQAVTNADSGVAPVTGAPVTGAPAPKRDYGRLVVVIDSSDFDNSDFVATWSAHQLPKLNRVLYLYSSQPAEDFLPVLSARLGIPLPGTKSPPLPNSYLPVHSVFELATNPSAVPEKKSAEKVVEAQRAATAKATEGLTSRSGRVAKSVVIVEEAPPAPKDVLRSVLETLYEWQAKTWPGISASLSSASIPFNAVDFGAKRDLETLIRIVRRAIDPFYAYRASYNVPRAILARDAQSSDDSRFAMGPSARSLSFQPTFPGREDSLPVVNFCPVCLVDDAVLVAGDTEVVLASPFFCLFSVLQPRSLSFKSTSTFLPVFPFLSFLVISRLCTYPYACNHIISTTT